MSGPRRLSCQQERRCQDSKMTSASQIKRQCQTKERLKCRGEKDARRNRRQPEGLSRFKDAENSEMSRTKASER